MFRTHRAACICGLGRSALLQILAIAPLLLRFAAAHPVPIRSARFPLGFCRGSLSEVNCFTLVDYDTAEIDHQTQRIWFGDPDGIAFTQRDLAWKLALLKKSYWMVDMMTAKLIKSKNLYPIWTRSEKMPNTLMIIKSNQLDRRDSR